MLGVSLVFWAVPIFVFGQSSDFMDHIVPQICERRSDYDDRIIYLACIEHSFGHALDEHADQCFGEQNVNGWRHAFSIFCQEDSGAGINRDRFMQCFTDAVNEKHVYHIDDVDRLVEDCEMRHPDR